MSDTKLKVVVYIFLRQSKKGATIYQIFFGYDMRRFL